jgi:hypothetical protein
MYNEGGLEHVPLLGIVIVWLGFQSSRVRHEMAVSANGISRPTTTGLS